MTTLRVTYPDWKAPQQDNATLLWPDAQRFIADTRDNARHLQGAHDTLLNGISLPEVRRAARAWAGLDTARPLIGTGHQTELYHAGVWAKEALIFEAARAIRGQSCHVAVDTDGPKHLSLRWPGGSCPITDDPRLLDAAWSGQLIGPSPAHLQLVARSLAQAANGWTFQPLASHFLDTLLALAPHEPELSPAIAQGMCELDRTLGIENTWLMVSPMLVSEPYLLFVHHVLSDAGSFASQYNRALGAYRIDHKIRSVTRPMPNLMTAPDQCETPFWLDELSTGDRTRATVQFQDSVSRLVAPAGEIFEFQRDAEGWSAARRLRAFLTRHGLRLSPRALTLTMYLRLCLVDQFVHGIGGGRYDQVTDALIAEHFGMEPPRFAVTTATLYFPDAAQRERACLPCLAHQGHQLKHRLLGSEKMELVSRIAALPRNSADRQMAFGRMHGKLAAVQLDHPVIRDWEQRFGQARAQSTQDQLVFDREMFYAIQSRERLLGVIEQYRVAFAGN